MRTRRLQSSSSPVSAPSGHQSVLLHEVLELLDPKSGETVLDATLGGAGHARALAEQLGTDGVLIGLDADEAAVARAHEALADVGPTVHLVRENFRNLGTVLQRIGTSQIDKALFDLGWSSYQLSAGRGFSFQRDEPLVMTYSSGTNGELTARDIVNEWAEESIADVLYGWGDERYARRIAKKLVERRAQQPIETARELADVISDAVPAAYRRGKIHPATKSFQALRIAVNDELGAITDGLSAACQALRPGGRLAVITFHSTEDRHVKQLLRAWERDGKGKAEPRKAVKPQAAEVTANPRARSAKLRIFHIS